YLNRAMLDLLRHGDAEQLLGHSPREIVATAGEGAIEAAERLERAAGVRVLQLDEQRLRRADGTTVEVELFATRADFDGSPAVVFTARDLTEKKALIARLAVSDRLAS